MIKTPTISFSNSSLYLKSLEFTFEEREKITQALIIGHVKCKSALEEAKREKASSHFIDHQTTWLAEVDDALEVFRAKDNQGKYI